MWLSETTHFIAILKQFIVEVALCLFVIIGVTRLILEELLSLIPLYKKVKAELKQDGASSDAALLPPREPGASSDDSTALASADSEPGTSAARAKTPINSGEKQAKGGEF